MTIHPPELVAGADKMLAQFTLGETAKWGITEEAWYEAFAAGLEALLPVSDALVR